MAVVRIAVVPDFGFLLLHEFREVDVDGLGRRFVGDGDFGRYEGDA